MSSLTALEKRTFEQLFDMGSGYVLGFSNRTFREFILDTVSRDIDDGTYDYMSGSKANRLRAFWTKEPDHVVARLLESLLELVELEFDPDPDLLARGRAILQRLQGAASVEDLAAIPRDLVQKDFERRGRSVHDSISEGEPELGLDRLHTFLCGYVDTLAEREGIATSKDKPLHSTFGELIKALRRRGAIETEMAERILKSTISTFESFNSVRNDRTYAHSEPPSVL